MGNLGEVHSNLVSTTDKSLAEVTLHAVRHQTSRKGATVHRGGGISRPVTVVFISVVEFRGHSRSFSYQESGFMLGGAIVCALVERYRERERAAALRSIQTRWREFFGSFL